MRTPDRPPEKVAQLPTKLADMWAAVDLLIDAELRVSEQFACPQTRDQLGQAGLASGPFGVAFFIAVPADAGVNVDTPWSSAPP